MHKPPDREQRLACGYPVCAGTLLGDYHPGRAELIVALRLTLGRPTPDRAPTPP